MRARVGKPDRRRRLKQPRRLGVAAAPVGAGRLRLAAATSPPAAPHALPPPTPHRHRYLPTVCASKPTATNRRGTYTDASLARCIVTRHNNHPIWLLTVN